MAGKGLPSYALGQCIKRTAEKKSPHPACTEGQKYEDVAQSCFFVIPNQKLT